MMVLVYNPKARPSRRVAHVADLNDEGQLEIRCCPLGTVELGAEGTHAVAGDAGDVPEGLPLCKRGLPVLQAGHCRLEGLIEHFQPKPAKRSK